MSSNSVDVHRTLRLQRLGSVVILQAFEGDKMVGHTLTCDLRTGTAAYVQHHPLDRDYTTIVGILGMYRMHNSTAFMVIDKAEEVCVWLYRRRGVQVYASMYTVFTPSTLVHVSSCLHQHTHHPGWYVAW